MKANKPWVSANIIPKKKVCYANINSRINDNFRSVGSPLVTMYIQQLRVEKLSKRMIFTFSNIYSKYTTVYNQDKA
jgi:hypothetical protein